MIKSAIDTEAIGKHIGNSLYLEITRRDVSQTDISKKLGLRQGNISSYLTGKITTKNLDQYWRIAEAIPISRSEFDQIVHEAKRKVLGDMGGKSNEDPKVAFFADLGVTEKSKQDAIMKMIEAFKDI